MRSLLFIAVCGLAACASGNGGPMPGGDDGTGGGDDGSGGGGGGGSSGSGSGDDSADIERDYDAVAASLGAVVGGPALSAMADSVVLSYGGEPAGFSRQEAGTVSGTRDGLAFAYQYHCHDMHDVVLPGCSAGADHGHVIGTLSGTISFGGIRLSDFMQKLDWTVTNLTQQQPRVDRKSTLSFAASVQTDGTQLQLQLDGLWTRVRFDPTPTLPSDGTIDVTIDGNRTRASAKIPTRDFTATASLTFASAGAATITLDGTHNYSVDMSSGSVTRI